MGGIDNKHSVYFLILRKAIKKMAVIVSEELTIMESGGNYFEVKTITYDNDDQDQTLRIMGDATALTGIYQARFIDFATRYQPSARMTVNVSGAIDDIITKDDEIATATIVPSPMRAMATEDETLLETSGWLIGASALAFTVDTTEALLADVVIYSISGGATKPAYWLREVLRLGDYPTGGATTDFFKMENGEFKSLDGKISITQP